MKETRQVILAALSALALILVPRIVGADEVRGQIMQDCAGQELVHVE